MGFFVQKVLGNASQYRLYGAGFFLPIGKVGRDWQGWLVGLRVSRFWLLVALATRRIRIATKSQVIDCLLFAQL